MRVRKSLELRLALSPLVNDAISTTVVPIIPERNTSSVSSSIVIEPQSLDSKLEVIDIPNQPPSTPLKWFWSCHVCHRTYPIGVTRRCIEDGHYFCAGVSEVKTLNRKTGRRCYKHHQQCSSEFDYFAWKEWGIWRRKKLEQQGMAQTATRSCDYSCDYPSECRWRVVSALSTEPKASVVVSQNLSSRPRRQSELR